MQKNKSIKTLLATCALLLALVATGCSTSLDRDGAIDDLVEGGIPRDQAECVIDRSVEVFGEDKMISDDDPTEEEQEQLLDIMSECLFGG